MSGFLFRARSIVVSLDSACPELASPIAAVEITKYDFLRVWSILHFNMLLGLSELGGRTCEFLEALSLPARLRKLQASPTQLP